jgi:hypothetical protein
VRTWRIWLALPAAILLSLSLFLLLWANQPSARWRQTFLISESQAVAQPASATGGGPNIPIGCLFVAALLIFIVLLILGTRAWPYLREQGSKRPKWLALVLGAGVLLASCCIIMIVTGVVGVVFAPAGAPAPGKPAVAAKTAVAPLAPTVVTKEVEKVVTKEAPATTEAPAATRPPQPTAVPTAPYYIVEPALEERIVELEWPESIRLGDSDLIRLTFSPRPEGGFTPTVEFGGHKVEPGTVTVPDMYATHYTFAIARLDAAGFDIQPGGEQEQELLPGQSLTYRWTLRARDAGQQRVALSLSLRWEPKAGVNDRMRTAKVWDRALEIQVRTALGLPGAISDWFGVGGSLLGTVMGFPFLETVLAALWKRLRRQG